MKMRLFFFIMILLISYSSRSQNVDVNIVDSNSVNGFIRNSTICEQIRAAQKFTSDIFREKGYGIKLLESLSTSTGYRFYIPIATGGILLTNSQKIEVVKEQLDELRKQKRLIVVCFTGDSRYDFRVL